MTRLLGGMQMKTFKNRYLSEKLDIEFQKWKRWSREFLSPNFIASLPKGKPREYTLNEAFIVFWGGHLLDLSCSIVEARRIIKNLSQWLTKRGQWPDNEGYKAKGVNKHIKSYTISIIPVKLWPKPVEGDKFAYPFQVYAEEAEWCKSQRPRFGFRYMIKGDIAQGPIIYEGHEVSSKIFSIEEIDAHGYQVPQIPRLHERLQIEGIKAKEAWLQASENVQEFSKDDDTRPMKVLEISHLVSVFKLAVEGWGKFYGE